MPTEPDREPEHKCNQPSPRGGSRGRGGNRPSPTPPENDNFSFWWVKLVVPCERCNFAIFHHLHNADCTLPIIKQVIRPWCTLIIRPTSDSEQFTNAKHVIEWRHRGPHVRAYPISKHDDVHMCSISNEKIERARTASVDDDVINERTCTLDSYQRRNGRKCKFHASACASLRRPITWWR